MPTQPSPSHLTLTCPPPLPVKLLELGTDSLLGASEGPDPSSLPPPTPRQPPTSSPIPALPRAPPALTARAETLDGGFLSAVSDVPEQFLQERCWVRAHGKEYSAWHLGPNPRTQPQGQPSLGEVCRWPVPCSGAGGPGQPGSVASLLFGGLCYCF